MSERAFPAHKLTIGDVVEPVLNAPEKLIGKVTEITWNAVTFGPYVIHSTGIEFRIHRFANGLPNTPAVAWLDANRREHVALQNGNPLNHSWLYNGCAVGPEDILDIAGPMPVSGLGWVDVPA